MKTIYILLFLAVLSVVSNKAFSQNRSQDKSAVSLLVGTWIFDYDLSIRKMDNSAKMHLDSVEQTRRNKIEKNYRGRKVTFGNKGEYKQTLSNGHTAKGEWELSKNHKNVIITAPNGFKYIQRIKFLSKTKLILKPIMEGKAKMLISEWNFVKSKS